METKGNYYLIDNEVRYYPASQLVKHPQSSVQLTDFQHKLLIYFLENPKVVRSHSQISALVWPNKITTVDAFNKPLGAIRNALSNTSKDKKNHYIKTWAREGYGLGCSCIFVEDKPGLPLSKSWPVRAITALTLAALGSVLFLFTFDPPVYEAGRFLKLTSLKGISAEPALSDDGKYIAFTSYDSQFKGSIYAKKLSERDHIELTQGHNDKMPTWNSTADKLLYQRLENQQCQVRMLTFSSPLVIQSDQKLLDCSPTSFYVSMTFENDHSFYFTDSKSKTGPYSVYLYDINSTTRTLHLDPKIPANKENTGYARIIYQPKQDKLYIIQSPDWINSDVLLYQNGQLTKLAYIDASLDSLGLFKNSFIYKDSRNRLMLHSQSQSLTTGWNGPIMHPTLSANSNKVAFYSGHMYHRNVFSFDTRNKTVKQLTFDDAVNRFPIKTAKHFYYSSDFTGITQIYRLPVAGKKQPIQLTNFKKNRRMTQVSLSPDNKKLAISYISGTDFYSLDNDTLTLVKRFKGQVHPAFSLDSQKMMLTGPNHYGNQTSTEYNLQTKQPTGIAILKSRFAVYHSRGLIYAKTDKTGIYLYNNGNTTTINDAVVTYSPADISANADDLYVVHKSDRVIKKLSFKGDKVTKLPFKDVGQLYLEKDVIYYSVEQLGKSSIYVGDIIER